MHALIVVDRQVGCFAGEPPRRDRSGTVARILELADAIRPHGVVIFIQHTDDDVFTRGSDCWQLLPELQRCEGDHVVEKCACDAFLETALHEVLCTRGISELVIVGCATDFCVDTTVRAAAARGYAVTVPEDAHTTCDRPHLSAEKIIEHHNYMWSDLILPRGGRVRVIPTEDLLSEWQTVAPGSKSPT